MATTLLVHERVDEPEALGIVEDDVEHDRLVELVVTARVTVPENPLCGETLIVELPGEPTTAVTTFGAADMVKSGGPRIVTITTVELVISLFVPAVALIATV